jgi:hypothetical protein
MGGSFLWAPNQGLSADFPARDFVLFALLCPSLTERPGKGTGSHAEPSDVRSGAPDNSGRVGAGRERAVSVPPSPELPGAIG